VGVLATLTVGAIVAKLHLAASLPCPFSFHQLNRLAEDSPIATIWVKIVPEVAALRGKLNVAAKHAPCHIRTNKVA